MFITCSSKPSSFILTGSVTMSYWTKRRKIQLKVNESIQNIVDNEKQSSEAKIMENTINADSHDDHDVDGNAKPNHAPPPAFEKHCNIRDMYSKLYSFILITISHSACPDDEHIVIVC